MSIPDGVLVQLQAAAKAVLLADAELSGYTIAVSHDPSLFPVDISTAQGRIDLCALASKDSVDGLRAGGRSDVTVWLTILVRLRVDVQAVAAVQDATSNTIKNLEEYICGVLAGDNRGFAVPGFGKAVYKGREVALQVSDLRKAKVATILSTTQWELKVAR